MASKKVLPIDITGEVVNIASEESNVLLRRLVKLLESQATVDSSNRQRIAVETMPTTAVTISSGTVSAITTQPVDQRFEMIDRARMAYAIGIRNNLMFS
jgi:hypothetical protein